FAEFGAIQTWTGRIAVVGVLAVCVLVGVDHFRHIRMEPKPHSNVAGMLPEAARAGTQQTTRPPSTDSSARMRSTTVRPKARQSGAHEPAALTEMHIVSYPAPKAPLTQEEKLLLRVVHEGDPQEMAMLNPEIRAKQEAQSDAEFQEFVEQSIKGDRE
ncbi:MAG: hypothetical protein WBQ94_14195, partial [Terracidiphilus sp.]